ncbi:MAG TPA: glycosyltransferase [Acidimicrobiia bacterium]|nr:glycosyltransferase [Acidimicrobiia bacterium]
MIDRIAFLSMHTSPLLQPGIGDAGGMNVYIDELSRTMAGRGVDTTVFTRRRDHDDPPLVEVVPGYRVRHVDAGPPTPLPMASLPRYVRTFAREVAASLRVDPPQILHSHYWLSGWAGLLVKRQLGIPLANSFHTLGRVKDGNRRPDEPPESLLRIAAEHEVIEGSDCVMASTPQEAQELLEFYRADPSRLCTSPPGVDHQLFRPGSRARARQRLGVGPGPVVLFVGRIQPIKGPDVAVEMMPAIVARHPDTTLVVVGGPSGPSGENELVRLRRRSIEMGLASRVRFLGPVPHGLVPDLYRAADVVVVPSRSESFGLVAAEAQACGRPVVAARIGGLMDVIDDGSTGMLVDGWDPADHAGAVLTLLDDPELAAKMGAAGVRWSRRFSWDATVRRYLELYRGVLTGG